MVALAEENDHLSCGEFARDLGLMREYDVKQADAPVDTANAVKLMTVHASKGWSSLLWHCLCSVQER